MTDRGVDPIGPRLRDRRKDLKLSQTKLADTVGISVSYLNLIEHSKRPIAGALLNRLAEALQIDTDELTGANNARLIQDLSEAIVDPSLAELQLSIDRVHEFVALHPKWARAIVALHRAYTGRLSQVEEMSERLTQNPLVIEAGQQIIGQVTAVRSMADLLVEVGDLNDDERQNFSQRLATTAKDLGSSTKTFQDLVFEQERQDWTSLTPDEQVDDFLMDHRNHFPELEEAAKELRLGLQQHNLQTSLELALSSRHKVRIQRIVGNQNLSDAPLGLQSSGYAFDRKRKILYWRDLLPEPTLRFQMTRVLAELEAGDAIGGILKNSDTQLEGEALAKGRSALSSYLASAIIYPYGRFLETAREQRYDLDVLVQRFAGSFEQVCHRLTTLRRPGAEGIPFSFLRSDMAGNSSKRFSVQGLRMPRHGSACPLWALYQAFRTPGEISVQLAQFPSNSRYLFIARTISKQSSAYRAPKQTYAIMIGCDMVYADQTVYADGLSASGPTANATPVGSTCRLCPRNDCPQRAHESLL